MEGEWMVSGGRVDGEWMVSGGCASIGPSCND